MKKIKFLLLSGIFSTLIIGSSKNYVSAAPVSYFYYNTSISEYTITDHDPFTQTDHDTFDQNVGEVIDFSDLTNKTIEQWGNDGYDTISFTVCFTAKKINRGYQKLYLYSTRSDDTDDKITDMELNLNGFTYKSYTKPIAFYINDKTSMINPNNTDPDYIEDKDRIYIRYGAHGSGDDDWMIKNIYVKITIS